MNQLFIHIGLPKTGTTTLQESLFTKLHFQDKINYLGISYTHSYKSKPCFYCFANDFLNKLWFDIKTNKPLEEYLDQDKINLFSSESLSGLNYIHVKKKRLYNPINYPYIIKDLFPENVSISVLLVLRSQVTKIPSSYAQGYCHYKDDYSKDNIGKFVSSIANDKDMFRTFYYDELIDNWVKVYGKDHIKILFFEDFLHNPTIFLKDLSSFLNVDAELIEEILKDKHHNKKEKNDFGTFVEYIERPLILKLFNKTLKPLFNKKIINNIKKIFGKEYFKKLSYKKSLIRNLTEQEKDLIFNEFKPSNERLWKEFDVDKDKLKKYNYI